MSKSKIDNDSKWTDRFYLAGLIVLGVTWLGLVYAWAWAFYGSMVESGAL